MKRSRGKQGGMKNVTKAKCYNCQKMGHFDRDCTELKKVTPNPSPSSFVCSKVFVANSLLGWIVDTGATKHVTRDRATFVDYHRVPACSHYIAMGNGTQEEVLRIGSYQLKLRTGRELLLSDVQYAPSIRCNLLSVTTLMSTFLHVNHVWREKPAENLLGKLRGLLTVRVSPSDICGPMNVRTRHGAYYFLTFIDEYSRYGYCEHSKGYDMYGEHPDRGMTEIELCNLDFLEEDLPSISNVKGDLKLYELRDPQGGVSIPGEDANKQTWRNTPSSI
ncbi:hypothetical protein Salat_0832600 [Sesamum alatum]|uniref:CCHC-type domain-containing protein n=1 Tax=Sesamum alatum TaxID=300844 RepID=A0AAE1YI94_9LAMI|nr:hypothetical protein Salat_0832600 [Sesamum alatum]